MKRAFVIVLALLISVALVTTVFAQRDEAKPGAGPASAPTTPTGPGTAKAKVMKFAGTVDVVDGMMVMVKGKKSIKTFDVTNATFKGFKDATAIKTGNKVSVTYEMAADVAMATKVTKIQSPAKAKPRATVTPMGSSDDQSRPGAGPAGAPIGK